MTAEPVAPVPVALPELAVPPHVLVVSLCGDSGGGRTPHAVRGAEATARVRWWTRQWLELAPGLRRHRRALAGLLDVALGEARPGEVAAFLDYRADGPARSSRLVGGAAILSLEVVPPIAGEADHRVRQMADQLERSAAAPQAPAGFCEVSVRSTDHREPATRLRFVAALGSGGPVVEVCRWLYPVPGHPDLLWALAYQTTDLDCAAEQVAGFDQLAASLRWVDPDE